MSDKVISRIKELIEQAESFTGRKADETIDERGKAEAGAWMAQALHIAGIILPDPNNQYRKRLANVAGDGPHYGAHRQVTQMSLILRRLIDDAANGLLVSIENRTSAKTFDDLLDHADAYLSDNRVGPAGVLAGVVFEDSIRKVCSRKGIDTDDKTLEPMINALAKVEVFSPIDAKQAKVCAGVRTSATHARWEELSEDHVKTCIRFTRTLIANELDA